MAAIEGLLDRFCERYEIATSAQLVDQFEKREHQERSDAWYAWSHAERAMRTASPELALHWLQLAQRCLGAHPDRLCEIEVLTSQAIADDWIEDTRNAAVLATQAWRGWLDLAEAPSPERVVPSARLLLAVLCRPEPEPDLDDEEVFAAWLEDRLMPRFEELTHALMGIHASLGTPEPAKAMAEQYLTWADRCTATDPTGVAKAVNHATILTTLGDVFDRCNDTERALDTFDEALAGLEAAGCSDRMTARLRFNRAGQLTKLGRYDEALAAYESIATMMEALGGVEAGLRVKYAIAFIHYKQGHLSENLQELISLAAAYEQELQGATTSSGQIETRLGLDLAYRLWLRVLAERFDPRDARGVRMLMQLFFALKEQQSEVASGWQQQTGEPEPVSNVTVLVDRIEQRPNTCLLLLEQVPDRLVFVSFRAGQGPWHERVHLATAQDSAAQALVHLLDVHRAALEALSDRAIPVRGAPSSEFVNSCRAAWAAVPEQIRADLRDVDRVLLCVNYQTDIDEIPLDLLHDDTTYLGLRAQLVQLPSLRDLNAVLGENWVNAAPSGAAVVVRSDDQLAHADAEAQSVSESLKTLGLNPEALRAPTPQTLVGAFCGGVDVFHYVGHGLADHIGEQLPLGDGQVLTARDIAAIGPAPAPLTVLSACLVGRSRQRRTGQQLGFAASLLEQGAPAVLATKHLLPDQVSTEYFALLYCFAAELALDDAALKARQTLYAQGCHPAAWSCFVLFGAPGALVRSPHLHEATRWPALVGRYLATGSADQLGRTLNLIDSDQRLTRKQREWIAADLNALASADASRFSDERNAADHGLASYAEADLTASLVRSFGWLRATSQDTGSAAAQDDSIQTVLSKLLAADSILRDNYLLIAAAVEVCRRAPLAAMNEGRDLIVYATRRAGWLTADPGIAAMREELESWVERNRSSMFVDAAALAGVDAATLQAADEGDQMAQRRMLARMLAAQASPEALVSTDWTPWLLRVIALRSPASVGDALGAIGAAARSGRISTRQHDALVRMLEMHLSPDAVDPDTANEALAAFPDAVAAIPLFLLYDLLASSEPGVDPAQIADAAAAATESGAIGAAAYFQAVLATRFFLDGRYDEAFSQAAEAASGYYSLRDENPGYLGHYTTATLLAVQIACATVDQDPSVLSVIDSMIDEGVDAVQRLLESDLSDVEDPVRAAIRVLVDRGQIARAQELLARAGDRLNEGARAELEELLGDRDGSIAVTSEDQQAELLRAILRAAEVAKASAQQEPQPTDGERRRGRVGRWLRNRSRSLRKKNA